jgi:hypothetical protein
LKSPVHASLMLLLSRQYTAYISKVNYLPDSSHSYCLLFPSPLHDGRIAALMKVFGVVFDGVLEKCRFRFEHEMQPIDANALELGDDDLLNRRSRAVFK